MLDHAFPHIVLNDNLEAPQWPGAYVATNRLCILHGYLTKIGVDRFPIPQPADVQYNVPNSTLDLEGLSKMRRSQCESANVAGC
jgi:hypothetical protein